MSVNSKLTAIADAIREKTGESGALTLDAMAAAIAGIEAGGGGVFTAKFTPAEDLHNSGSPIVFEHNLGAWPDFVYVYADVYDHETCINKEVLFSGNVRVLHESYSYASNGFCVTEESSAYKVRFGTAARNISQFETSITNHSGPIFAISESTVSICACRSNSGPLLVAGHDYGIVAGVFS